jgi:hypothetical protein
VRGSGRAGFRDERGTPAQQHGMAPLRGGFPRSSGRQLAVVSCRRGHVVPPAAGRAVASGRCINSSQSDCITDVLHVASKWRRRPRSAATRLRRLPRRKARSRTGSGHRPCSRCPRGQIGSGGHRGGLYFLGLSWQHTSGSALLGVVNDDAALLARLIAALQIGDRPSPTALPTRLYQGQLGWRPGKCSSGFSDLTGARWTTHSSHGALAARDHRPRPGYGSAHAGRVT